MEAQFGGGSSSNRWNYPFYSICILRSISVMPTIASSCLSRSLKSLMVFPPIDMRAREP